MFVSAGMLDRIKVAAYGESTPSHTLKSLAGVAVRSPQLLAVSVFDPSVRASQSCALEPAWDQQRSQS